MSVLPCSTTVLLTSSQYAEQSKSLLLLKLYLSEKLRSLNYSTNSQRPYFLNRLILCKRRARRFCEQNLPWGWQERPVYNIRQEKKLFHPFCSCCIAVFCHLELCLTELLPPCLGAS